MRTLTILLLLTSSAWAQAPDACKSPRVAAQTFLDNLQADSFRPRLAIVCFERFAGATDAVLIQRARDLKAVLDHRGLFVVMEDLPEDKNYKDERGRQQVPLAPGLPAVYLQRVGGEWQIPEAVVRRIPRLYRDTFSSWGEAVVNRLPPILRAEAMGYQLWQPIALLLLLGLCFLVSRLTRLVARSRLVNLLTRMKIADGREALAGAGRPIGLLVATGLFAFGLPELRLPIGTARVMAIGVKVVAIWAAILLAYRLIDLVIMSLTRRAAGTETRADDQLVVLLRKTLRAVLLAVGIVFVLQNLNVDVTSLLAGLGIGGLALALAAKDTAANLFGSITILVDQPFYVGDWIKAADAEGTVLEIGLRSTRIRTFYDSEVIVPNSKLAIANIDNYSRRNYRRFKATLCIGYDSTPTQIQAFVEGVRAIIARHPDTRKDSYEVHFVGYGDSWLEILVYTFFQVPGWSDELRAKHDLLIEIKRLADDVGVEFAFPTRTLHVETQAVATEREAPDAADADALAGIVHGFGPGGDRGWDRGRPLTDGFLAGASARGDG